MTLPRQYSTRLTSILKLFELEECITDYKLKDSWDETRINWNKVNKKLEIERAKSRSWLENVVKELLS